MRILMVTPYPPARDGIANYALQEVRHLRAEGHDVEVLSPAPSAAHHHLALSSPRGPLALARRVPAYDRVIIQFHPDVFYPQPLRPRRREQTTLGLLGSFRRCRELEVRIHEVNYGWGTEGGRHAALFKAMWRQADRITLHTERELDAFASSFGLDRHRLHLFEHGTYFERRVTAERDTAREALGIPKDQFMFLSIGFVQPHKGFDRGVRAFAGLDPTRCRLDVVGSLRVDDPAYAAYAKDLAELIADTPGARLHQYYVSDTAFDQWLVAADCIVLPYRNIWSSGVMERAALYGRPVIATAVGGLANQAPAGTVLVDDDAGLARAMRHAASGASLDELAGTSSTSGAAAGAAADAATTAAAAVPLAEIADRDEVMRSVRERATLSRRAAPARFTAIEQRTGQSAAAARAADLKTSTSALSAVDLEGLYRKVPELHLTMPAGRNPLATLAKRAVLRLTFWQMKPLVDQMNQLRQAGIETARAMARTSGGDGRD